MGRKIRELREVRSWLVLIEGLGWRIQLPLERRLSDLSWLVGLIHRLRQRVLLMGRVWPIGRRLRLIVRLLR